MKYRPTILNLASLIFFIDVCFDVKYAGEWGLALIFGAGMLTIVALLIDLFLQKVLKNKIIINLLGIIPILAFYIYTEWYNRLKTVIIPDNFKGYVSIVYNVENQPPLFTSSINFGYDVVIPESGILFTSTKLEDDIWKTVFKLESGTFLNNISDTTKLHAVTYDNGDFKCSNNNWKFRTWLVSNQTGWNIEKDIDSVSRKKMKEFCDRLNIKNMKQE